MLVVGFAVGAGVKVKMINLDKEETKWNG